jgi:hypothetical protein
MVKRRFSFYSVLIWRKYVIGAPATLLDALVHWMCPFQMIKKIRVVDPISETRDYFIAAIERALTLIATSDSVRFNRVQREIHSIVSGPAPCGSIYGRPLRVCSVDLRCYYVEDDPNMTIMLVASALVREATVGHLLSKGILRTRRNYLRFDHLCMKEAQQFLQQFGMTTTPLDSEQFAVTHQAAFWKSAVKTIHGVFVRNSAGEAAVWKKLGIFPRDDDQ